MKMRELRAVFLVAFGFVIIAGALLQLVVLPATPWHAGAGLMAGGDWVSFHRLAIDLAETIRTEGWSSWVLRVDGQAPASVAAAFYVLTGLERPLVLLPLHGLLYGIVAMCLYSLARDLGASHRQAWLVLLPLFLFPSTAMIWGQIHKDIYSIAGVLLVLRFWLRLWVMYSSGLRSIKVIMGDFALLALGMLLILFVRPYLAEIVFVASMLAAIVLLAGIFISSVGFRWFSPGDGTHESWLRILLLMAMGIAIQVFLISVEKPPASE